MPTPVATPTPQLPQSQNPDVSPRSQDTTLSATGPETNRLDERRSIYQRLTERLFGKPTPSSDTKESASATPPSQAEQLTTDQESALKSPLSLKGQLLKVFSIRSLSDLYAWARESFELLTQSVDPPQRRTVRDDAEKVRPNEQPTFVSSTPTQASNEPHVVIVKERELNTTPTDKEDFTGQALKTVAEATRKEHERDAKKEAERTEERQREKERIKEDIIAIDFRDGAINQDLSEILNEFDGTYGSAEVALRKIAEAQAKEALLKRRKVIQ